MVATLIPPVYLTSSSTLYPYKQSTVINTMALYQLITIESIIIKMTENLNLQPPYPKKQNELVRQRASRPRKDQKTYE
jgi:hypothetical protein